MKHLLLIPGILSALLASAAVSRAYTESDSYNYGSEFGYSTQVADTTGDLLIGLTPTLTSGSGPDFGFPLSAINDGQAGPTGDIGAGSHDVYFQGSASFAPTSSLNSDPTVTFAFDTGAAPGGYNISSIDSIYGWQDVNSFNIQSYTITYTLVGSSAVHTLGTVDYVPATDPSSPNPFLPENSHSGGTPASTMVSLSGVDLSGVSSISFQFTPYYDSGTTDSESNEQWGQLIDEVQVYGTAPEPSTYALMAFGLAGLVLLGWNRRRAALR